MPALKEYRRRRNFRHTPEPRGKRHRDAAVRPKFVVQKHSARRLHYDFRLEMAGVLKSWAVPKGIPTAPGVRRLAIEVEDHPLEYGNFEGTIAPGNYGAGTVMLWDRGTYEVLDGSPLASWRAGKLHLHLHGKKLEGEWTLVRTKSDDDKPQWLLLKSGNRVAPISEDRDDQSVLTGRSLQEIAGKLPSLPERELAACPRQSPAFVEPMKARLVSKLPAGKEWNYEIKFDGYRALALKRGKKVELLSRNNRSLNARFPGIARALAACSCRFATLDGEIVALDEQGRSSFQLLQDSASTRPFLAFYVFDMVNYENRDVRRLPLEQRRLLVQRCLAGTADPVRVSASLEGNLRVLVRELKRHDLEGLVAKRRNSRYETGLRTGAWVKWKFANEQEFVIGGYTTPRGARQYFGAILVGYYDKGRLRYAAKVGTGFDERRLRELHNAFQPLHQKDCPFTPVPRAGLTGSELRTCTWLKPKLVCQVRFSQWTRDGSLRQPVFLGLRTDKKPREVIREGKH